MSNQYGRNTAYYNQRPLASNVNNPGYTTYRDVSNVNRRTEASSPMIFRDSRQGNQERVNQYGYQQDYKMVSSARKGLPFNSTSRLDFETEFGLQGGRDHDGMGYQDDRIQNILLDEICSDFGIKDSIDLDLYNLDTVYPTTRLSHDLEELDQTIPFGKFDAEAELGGTMMPPPSVPNRLRSQQNITSGSVKSYQSKSGPPLTQGFIEKSEAVASPTISSSCEGGTSLTAISGAPVVVKPQPPDSTSGDCGGSGGWSNVHSTTVSGGCAEEEVSKGVSHSVDLAYGEKLSTDKAKFQSDKMKKEESGDTNNYLSSVKLENYIPESQPVLASGGRNINTSGEFHSKSGSQIPPSVSVSRRPTSCGIPNFSAIPSARSSYQNTVQAGSGVNRCLTTVGSEGSGGCRGSTVSGPVSEDVQAGESGATSCSTSTSVSPSQMHVAKKLRTINSGSDLLEEVRECFAYVHGADLFAPTNHSSFNNPSADVFKPQFDNLKNMNFGGHANFSGREYVQQPHQQMQQPGPSCYPQGGDGFNDTPTRRTIAPKSYVGDQFGGMERSRGGGGYGPAMSYNVSSPSVGSMGYQSCPNLTSPARQVPPFSPGLQGSPYQSRPYSPAGIGRSSQQYDMGTISLAHHQQPPVIENLRNPVMMTQRNNIGNNYGQETQSSLQPDGGVGYDGLRNSPRPAHTSQRAMPQSPASFQMHQQQTQSAPCTPSKQRWDGTYHQGAMQGETFRGSPSSVMTMSHGPQQMLYPKESMGRATMHNPSLGRMQENQFTMNNNNVCATPGKSMGNVPNNESMDRMNRTGIMGRNDLVSEGYNSSAQDGRSRDDNRYSSYSPGLNINNYRRGTNYPVSDRPTGRETYRSNNSIAPVNAASIHASRGPQNYGAFVNTGMSAHDLPLSQHSFLRRLIGEDSGAYSVHPLYPLLRDLIIADMNFHTPSFPFKLIAHLPSEFETLLFNYRQRNPGLSLDHADPTVQMVVIDAVKYAHSALIGKIQTRRRAEGYMEKPTQNMDDFCDSFERSVTRAPNDCQSEQRGMQQPELHPMYSDVNCGSGPPSGFAVPYPVDYDRGVFPGGDMMLPHHRGMSSTDLTSSMPYGLNYMPHAPHLYYDDDRLVQSLPSSPRKLLFKQMGGEGEKAGKNKVLPKEAVSVMIEWLREHQENPYPNDDEKESLIESTKLTINQINYWFTNARRRILPKWALQRHIAEQEKGRQNNKSTAELIEDRERNLQRHGSPNKVGGD